ncbi:MAG: alpha-amylase [Acidobacteriota bacterium]
MHAHTTRRIGRILLAAFLLLAVVAPLSAQTNGTMMQYYHWYLDKNDNLWNQVAAEAANLSNIGVTALWLPPATKGDGVDDVGYGIYDIFDLGEFNQKGTVRTKYGTKAQYFNAINAAHNNGMQIYFDVVLNHKMGADTTENVTAVRVDTGNRNNEYGGNVNIDAWTKFDFPGRGNQYSSFKWRWYHFDGVDWAQNLQEGGRIYKFRGSGKAWDWEVDTENANYDYLLGADVDFAHTDVVNHYNDWGVWVVNHTGIDGFRLDAVKHIKYDFWNGWLDHVRSTTGQPLFTVAEFWSYDIGRLHNFINKTGGRMSVFDAPLHLNFHIASNSGGSYDMRNIMNNTLMQQQPALAVTLVDNHDTQPLQALESPVQDWFKPLAYAFILLREEGYPNIFYADYYGANYTDKGITINLASHRAIIDKLAQARRDYAYGPQINYLDHWNVIGWTRLGDASHPHAMAVILSDGSGGSKWMNTGKANTAFTDVTGNRGGTVTTNGSGWGNFPVNGGSVSVWVSNASGGGGGGAPAANFTCNNGTTFMGQDIYVVGSIAALGNWNTANAVKLNPTGYPTWTGTVTSLPANTSVSWKCIKKHGSSVVWQGGANNTFTTGTSGTVSTSGSF